MTKYQRPLSRSFGETFPNAQGECYYGTVANSTTGHSCGGGENATGSSCVSGSFAQGTGCYGGGIPAGDGCSFGFRAGQPGGCHSGESAT